MQTLMSVPPCYLDWEKNIKTLNWEKNKIKIKIQKA